MLETVLLDLTLLLRLLCCRRNWQGDEITHKGQNETGGYCVLLLPGMQRMASEYLSVLN